MAINTKIAKKPSKKTAKRESQPVEAAQVQQAGRLIPPKGGAVIRMYRIGHGDCFLLAFASEEPDQPVYVLIDCGYKPGSSAKLGQPTTAAEIAQDIKAATGGHVHVAVVTHEHQDHCNGITQGNFGAGLSIGQLWLAWTENPKDELANRLRAKFNDQLLGLRGAHQKLALSGAAETADLQGLVEEMLELELGEEVEGFNVANAFAAAGKNPANSANKQAMALFKHLASSNVEFHVPHDKIRTLDGAPNVRVFSLGPPRDEAKLKRLDPVGDEEFHAASGLASAGAYFGAAAGSGATGDASPFPLRYVIPRSMAFPAVVASDDGVAAFFQDHYGAGPTAPGASSSEVANNEEWRRIDNEWLFSAGALALAMNSQTNNASLVLAFELGKGGKVLLFAADAQAGNWRSWSDAGWKDGNETVSARDLLSRAVLYKVGHHGSHNATLDGEPDDAWANLSWMARGRHGDEFVAMVTAVEAWAHQKPKPDWDHPLKSIKDALVAKAGGRVLQTDTDVAAMAPALGSLPEEWQEFQRRFKHDRLYFDLTVEP